ncbi:MAG: hypothetical protein CMF62_02155 [Magnetococcales bacterium]|nr:hypothetical protein [Magnetococcales bacterium]|tara:strand:- start:169318 stop:169881 length:564 start_codon:yes stop_codon:yes gene_type:complete
MKSKNKKVITEIQLSEENKNNIKQIVATSNMEYKSNHKFYKESVWLKTFRDFNTEHKDNYGKIIRFSDYGKDTKYSWEIDHIKPESTNQKNINNLKNLRALNKTFNRKLGNIQNNIINYENGLMGKFPKKKLWNNVEKDMIKLYGTNIKDVIFKNEKRNKYKNDKSNYMAIGGSYDYYIKTLKKYLN